MSCHSKEIKRERLLQLSKEVSRIATTLARLATEERETEPQSLETGPEDNPPEVAAETIASVIHARRLRQKLFPKELFADPAWDMLLDLLRAEILQRRVSVSSLCIAAAVPGTTALRYINSLVDRGLFVRQPDLFDSRRIYIALSPAASLALRRYFAELGAQVE